MKTLVSIIALALAVAFTAPAFAGGGIGNQPLTKADCKRAGLKWSDQANVCGSKAR
jgi:hypothetical protein